MLKGLIDTGRRGLSGLLRLEGTSTVAVAWMGMVLGCGLIISLVSLDHSPGGVAWAQSGKPQIIRSEDDFQGGGSGFGQVLPPAPKSNTPKPKVEPKPVTPVKKATPKRVPYRKPVAKKSVPKKVTPPPPPKPSVAPLSGYVTVSYMPTENPELYPYYEILKESLIFQTIADEFNQSMRLPRDVKVVFRPCGRATAIYNPKDDSILMCYEVMDSYFAGYVEELERQGSNQDGKKSSRKVTDTNDELVLEMLSNAVDATVYTFYHQLANAMVDQLELHVDAPPHVTLLALNQAKGGIRHSVVQVPSEASPKEPLLSRTQAIDTLMSLILLEQVNEGAYTAMTSVQQFALGILSDSRKDDLEAVQDNEFWSEQALSGERVFNTMCLIYGSNPSQYQSLVGPHGLPKQKMGLCGERFTAISPRWKPLMKPYLSRIQPPLPTSKPHPQSP